MSDFHKRERRYAARAREIKQHIHGQFGAWELIQRLAKFLPMSVEHSYRLHQEMCRLLDNPNAFIPVIPRVAIIAIPFYEIDPVGLSIWWSARYQLIGTTVPCSQPAWRRSTKGRKK